LSRLLLVDDHPVVRAGCQRLLEMGGEHAVVAQAGDAEAALEMWQRHRPDLVVTDLSLPGCGGLELLRRLRERDGDARVLVFSMLDSEPLVCRALALGARGYMPKSADPACLIDAVAAVLHGRRVLGPGLSPRLLEAGTASDPFAELTPREFELFGLLARGLAPADCAQALHLSTKTVSNLQSQIRDKLGLDTSAAMAHLALRHGLIASDTR
jgi:DNA-binding NarL/FixJ family response regulator